ncbi:amino acid adenylation domain-containing protein [Streptomyces indicus]|uniref:Nonribosomal peptide synthetase DhbF n=1 Tax=Streptomyces indicus TaxID=417292 RepID=A0A1G8UFN1_9ACTN|nr:non-ribosomal peptide synthetase [Streptomyces indicus]SDJ52559.1 nonribosomal peptide synthetase DhbF [Streptomyces indicus]
MRDPETEDRTGASSAGISGGEVRLPLLAAQSGIWHAQHLDPANPVLNTGDRVEITGPLDADLFEQALRQAVSEADTLNLEFSEGPDGPLQQVVRDRPWTLERLDLRADPDPRATAEAWMRADLELPVDPVAGPLMTQALLRIDDETHWWYRRVHHIAVDAYALTLISSRVAAVYTALTKGEDPAPNPFGALGALIADEQAYLGGEQHAADREFWRTRFADRPRPVTLAGRPAAPARHVLRRAHDLAPGTADRLTEAARAVKATWAELVIAATAGYTHRITGAEDIVLGLPLMNRRGPEALRTPAMLVNVMPLRIAVRPADTGAELLRRVVLEVRSVRRHQRHRLEELRHDLGRSADPGPLFGPMVNIKAFEDETLDFAGLPGTVHNLAAGPVDDLAVTAAPGRAGGLRLGLDANPACYDAGSLATHARGFLRYLDALTSLLLDDPGRPVGSLDLLDADEIRSATAGRTEPPCPRTLPELFAEQAARTPDAVAVRGAADGAGQALTFAELDHAANQLAHELSASGVVPGDPVALALHRGTDTVLALLAVLKAGGVCQSLDLGHPAQRLTAVVADARPVCVLGHAATVRALPAPVREGLPALLLDDAETRGRIAGRPGTAPAAPRPEQDAYLIHTSGSTGRPKGVVVTHASLANLYAGHGTDHIAPAVARTGRERLAVAHSASFAFDASWDPILWMAHGHELHVLDDATYRDTGALNAYVQTHRIDYLDVTPSYAEALVAEGLLEPGRHHPAVIVVGGETVPPALWRRLAGTPGVRPINLYGPTETTVDAYYWLPAGTEGAGSEGAGTEGAVAGDAGTEAAAAAVAAGAAAADSAGAADAQGAGGVPADVGRPMRASRAYVLDSSLRPVPPGVTGELYIAGACLARGYLGRPDLTAERFVADPFGPLHGEPGARMYRTGDLVRRRADHTLEFLGRADDQVKIRGFRIEPGEIQTVLAAHPQVAQAAVIARDSAHGKRLLAYAVPASGAAPDPAALRDHLAARLPEHMVPSALLLLDALPRTPNDKLDHHALPDPVPTAEEPAETGQGTPQQDLVRGLFARLLDLPELPSPHADFFALGGHSLLAGRLAARLRETFRAEVTLADVFRAPTPARLAALVREAAHDADRPVLEPARRPAADAPQQPNAPRLDGTSHPDGTSRRDDAPHPDGATHHIASHHTTHPPLSPAQKRLWFLHRLEGPSPTYNIPLVLTLTGPLDQSALQAALRDVTERHSTLRTVYGTADNEPFAQVIPAAEAHVPFAVEPLTDPAPLATRLRAAVRHPFDLASELPLRATLFTDDTDGQHTLLLLLHHIAADGASTTPLARDLATAYAARSEGRAPQFTALPVAYADHTAWQQRLLGTPEAPTPYATRLLDHWRATLSGLPDELELPTDRPRPAVASYEGDAVPFEIDAATHTALRTLARDTGTTAFMVVQAALATLLTRHGAGTDLPIGTPVAGREEDATADLVGFFVNTLVLRTDTFGAPTFCTLLDRVRSTVLAAHQHAELPFDRLVEDLNPPRSLARHPLFQTMLVWQSVPDTEFRLGALTARMDAVPSGTAKFDLTLNVGERAGGGIGGFLEFRTDLYDRATAQAFADRLARLLTAAVARPDTPIGLLPLLSPEEHHQAIVEWNNPTSPALGPTEPTDRPTTPAPSTTEHPTTEPPTTLATRYEAVAARHPHRTAATCGEEHLTYAELSARANRLARTLTAQGIGPGAIVALALPRSLDLVVGLLAVAKSGAAYLPMDPDYPADRLAYMLQDARPAALVTDSATVRRLPANDLPLVLVDAPQGERPAFLGPHDRFPQHPDHDLTDAERTRPLRPTDMAYVIYTSGSTGRPKGVPVTHHNVLRLFTATEHWFGFEGAAEPDVWTLFHSYAFDFSVWELWGALLHGGRVVVVSHLVSRDPAAFLDLLAREKVTVVNQTPSAFYQLAAADRERPGTELALRYVVFGGEALELGRLDDWYARHAEDAPVLVNMYGITETTVHVSYFALDRETAAASASSTIGVNIPDLRVYVLDEYLQPVPPGVTGEMYVAGEGLARGYLGRHALTAERFVADPYGPPGTRMYRSGDLARRRTDGRLDYFGRADHQVKIRGFRIELGEIEAVLAAHPEVADVAVIVREDTPGDKRLVAYAVSDRTDVSEDAAGDGTNLPGHAAGGRIDLREHAARELPAHMVPSAVVLLDRLPLTANGKLDRKALPAPDHAAAVTAGRAPRGPREAQLCELFADVLGLPRVGVDDNFFDLGGHSLLAVRLAGRIKAALGREVTIGTVFQAPTPAALEAALDTGDLADDPLDVLLPLRPAGPDAPGNPFFAVHPAGGLSWCYAGLIRHLPEHIPLYGLQAQGVGRATADRPLPTTLEELAAHYVDRLREVRPEGPYRLLGWSTGGIIAHAMATRLQDLGQRVELLAILDAYPAEGFRDLPVPDQAEALEALLTMGGYGPDSLEGKPLELAAVAEVLRREGSPLASLDDRTIEALNSLYLNTNHLVRGFDHRLFDGDVLFFRATVDTIDDTLTPETWTPYVTGRIENTDVACSHKDMTLPEPIGHIARVVADRIEEIERTPAHRPTTPHPDTLETR